MAEIRPFRGLVYSSPKADGDISAFVAPPYDVISEKHRDDLYSRSEYNIIRLILGKEEEGDGPGRDKYTRARATMERWIDGEVLVKDGKPGFYVYRQVYEFGGKEHTRLGFLGLMKIGEKGNDDVIPHEHTLSKPKEDRLNLIKQVKSNLSPIFTIFLDEDGSVDSALERTVSEEEPMIDISLEDGTHTVWRMTDEDLVLSVTGAMRGKKVFIADGHHRYEVSRAYRDLLRKEPGYDGRADYVLMYFADMTMPDNLTVMATHRALKSMPISGAEARARLEKYFKVEKEPSLAAVMARIGSAGAGEHRMGYIDPEGSFSLVPKDEASIRELIREDRSDEWKDLDVSVLHSAVLDSMLGIGSVEGNITYVRDAEEAEELVAAGTHAAAFVLNPTRVDQLRKVAENGEMMPQKSTYFYPKLLTGLVINRMEACGERSGSR